MGLPNPGMDAVPFTPLTAEFLDDIIANIQSLSSGTGFGSAVIPTSALTDGAATNTKISSGWVTTTDTWSYSSYTSATKTGVITVPSDATTRYSVGMRVAFTNNASTQYGIITALTSTSLTIYFGTDYSLTNSAITNPSYSVVKAPLGFPLSPAKWTVVATQSTSWTVTSSFATAPTWGTAASSVITLPIGVWRVNFNPLMAIDTSSTSARYFYATLSTGTTETNPGLTLALCHDGETTGAASAQASLRGEDFFVCTTATPLNALHAVSSTTGVNNIAYANVNKTLYINAVCAYL